MGNPIAEQIKADVEHFRKTYNLPERHVYKYEDGSGESGYIVTEKPIALGGPGEALNVRIFFDGSVHRGR